MEKNWKILQTEEEYDVALNRTISLFHSDKNTPEGKELDLLISLVRDYEDRHYHIPAPGASDII